ILGGWQPGWQLAGAMLLVQLWVERLDGQRSYSAPGWSSVNTTSGLK
ncbi:MAG: hypothetical protein JWO21_956, partial [Solirubrobacterales bacterium]|nr:hypothetical protein [Solirubrobacterales bacterium]